MSDSEEEASFASADEGDGTKTRESSKGAKNQKGKESVDKSGDREKESKESGPTHSKKEAPKGSDKQRQQQSKPKGQGKGDERAAQKDAGSKNSPPLGQSVNEPKTPTGAKTSAEARTSSEAKTPTGDKTSTGDKISAEAKTPTGARTSAEAKTPTGAKTSAEAKLSSEAKTPSEVKTPETKTSSQAKTPEVITPVAKTPSEAKTAKVKTLSAAKTPSEAKTPVAKTSVAKTPSDVKTPEAKTSEAKTLSRAQISEAPGDFQEKANLQEKQNYGLEKGNSMSTATPSEARETPKDRITSKKDLGKNEVTIFPGKQQGDLSKSGSVQRSLEASQGKQQDTLEESSQQEAFSPGGQAIPRDRRDHTPEQEEVLKKLTESSEKSSGSGWGWSSWGSSILSAATNSVQTFTHQVGDGFSTIMETVESSLGVPDPEDMLKAQDVTEPTPSSEDQLTVTSQPDLNKPEETAKTTKIASSEKSKSEIVTEVEDDTDKEKLKEKKEDGKNEVAGGGGDSWFSGWSMSDLAKKVQDTGKSLASKGQTLMSEGFDAVENLAAGGIDVLESIGKKTYNTLSEHDPAFRKTRDFLSPKGNKPNLSSVLKEAKEKAEYEAVQEQENEETRKAHFGTLFDNYQGIAHLEALEMLSNQSEKKVHSLLNALASSDLARIKPTLITIKEAFEIIEEDSDTPKEQDFSSLVSQYVSELELGTAPDKLNKVHEMVKQWVVDFDSHDSHDSDSLKEIHQKSIQALAELTAKGVEQFHKAGELVLFERDKDKDCTERARSLARLTGVLCHEVGNLASKFVEILNKMAGEGQQIEEVTPLVTNVYLEATNSNTYIQDAFQLLLPVLQQAALEHSILARQS